MLGLDLAEVTLQHGVHAQAHVFDPAAGQEYDAGVGVAGDGVGNLVQFREGFGQLEEHDGGPRQELRSQRVLFKAAGDAQLRGVVPERPLTGDEVLMHAHRTGPAAGGVRVGAGVGVGVGVEHTEREGAEGQRTVPVPHDGDPAAGVEGSGSEQVRGGVQEEFVRGVPGLQVGRLHVREPAHPGEEGIKSVVRHARAAAFCESGVSRGVQARRLRFPANLSCSSNKRRMPATAARPARLAPIVDEDGP